MHQVLCDVCEQPIADAYDRDACLRLNDSSASLYGPPCTVDLHIHRECWRRVRTQFLSERTLDDEEALKFAHQVREAARPWFDRLVDWILRVKAG